MAYNPYVGTAGYNPAWYQNQPMFPTQMTGTQQIQNGGLVSVRSEQEARNYPTAPGNSITFKDESQPYVYVKTMGFNQMEQPVFKKYRLVEEAAELDVIPTVADKQPASWASKTEIEELRQAYAQLSDKVEAIRNAVNLFTDKEVTNE